jgi:hypothetical protein
LHSFQYGRKYFMPWKMHCNANQDSTWYQIVHYL